MERNGANLFLIVLGALIFTGFGLILTPYVYFTPKRVTEELSWPLTEASIFSAHAEQTSQRMGGLYHTHHLSFRYSPSNHPVLVGKVVTGKWATRLEAERALPKIGSTFPIRYSPSNPEKISIQTQLVTDSDVLPFLVVSVFLALGGLGLTVASWFSGNQKKEPNQPPEPTRFARGSSSTFGKER